MVLATDSSDETQEWMMRILEGVAGTGAVSQIPSDYTNLKY